MATELQVDIVTPQRLYFTGAAGEVRLPAWEGEMGVLPDHDIYLVALRGGVARVLTPQGERAFVVGRGFAEVGHDRVTLLTDSCQAAEDVDRAAAQAELAEIERLATEGVSDPTEIDALEERYELVRARLSL